MPYLPPQHPQVSKPDRRKAGRRRRFSRSARAARTPVIVASNCFASRAWRRFTRWHNSSDNTQLRHLGPDPLGLGVRARHTLACVRVLDEALPVPDQHAGIKLVVDDAVAPAGVTPDRRVAPGAA